MLQDHQLTGPTPAAGAATAKAAPAAPPPPPPSEHKKNGFRENNPYTPASPGSVANPGAMYLGSILAKPSRYRKSTRHGGQNVWKNRRPYDASLALQCCLLLRDLAGAFPPSNAHTRKKNTTTTTTTTSDDKTRWGVRKAPAILPYIQYHA